MMMEGLCPVCGCCLKQKAKNLFHCDYCKKDYKLVETGTTD